ncbi:BON domain-containing protein [Roseiconus nitratireducens]|uniref:BON domain-containing protein n=1 Tax=Roseiconus nitratireducens TaxID=2605748 RepID=UPI0013759ACF|nr:BON domain-containing protein [Roseiconus nitratireducens]
MRRPTQLFRVAAIVPMVAILIHATNVQGQQIDTGQTGGQAGSGTTGVGAGSQFSPDGPDMSAFEGIQRGDTVGSTDTQGFGLGGETTGNARTGGGLGGAFGGGALGGGGLGRGGFGGGLGGLGGLFGALGGAGQGTSTQPPAIRVRLRSAVEVQPLVPTTVRRTAVRRLVAVPGRAGLENVNVSMDGRTAVLTGVVGTAKDRRMSELLLRLEPGISRVDNQLVVQEASQP